MKVSKIVLEKCIGRHVLINGMQFGLMEMVDRILLQQLESEVDG